MCRNTIPDYHGEIIIKNNHPNVITGIAFEQSFSKPHFLPLNDRENSERLTTQTTEQTIRHLNSDLDFAKKMYNYC